MGIISRKIFPACGNMCVCCPALRSRSRQPVKRYKKLLAEVFPKSADGPPNERKIVKLCEYAAKNSFRIPKITMYLEERCYKEVRSQHVKYVEIIAETYNKLLSICRDQMACFALGVLNVVAKLLDESEQDAFRIIGCQLLTRFIYSQVDGTYTYNLESLVEKICSIARGTGEEHKKLCLRSSSLQCLSAMVWFMGEFSHIFYAFDEIIYATIENYEPNRHSENDGGREAHHNWVDEVVRCEGRGIGEFSPGRVSIRPRPERKDPSRLAREEVENPNVWAQISIQRMVELAKESTTVRRILDPMFFYFDKGRHWVPPHGLALVVLSDMCYFMESSGNQLLVLAGVVRHLDHKNIVHDPQIKSLVIQTATYLARQIRSGAVLSAIGFVSDLCKHLRKSLQATFESVGEHELDMNVTLQTSMEDLLLEIAKGINDARPLFDIMAILLEEISSVKVVARATIGSLVILAHMISLAAVSSHSQQVFPETLLLQLLKVMLHPDVDVRLGGHHIFSVLLIPSPNCTRYEFSNYPKRWHSNSTSTVDSVSALLEKLRREKGDAKLKNGISIQDELKERDIEDEAHQGWVHKNSPNFNKISSIIDKTVGSASLTEAELSVLKIDEDQIAQVLTAFWMQANLSDNVPANIEAIAHSFCLTLVSSRLKNTQSNLIVRFFHIPLSLLRMSLDPDNGSFPPAYKRSLLVLSTAILMFAARSYHIADLVNLLKPLLELAVDPYIGISDDCQVYVKPQADVREYYTPSDNQDAAVLISQLHSKMKEYEKIVMDLLVESLSNITQVKVDDLFNELSEGFRPDDALMFGPQSILDFNNVPCSKDSPSSDGELPTNLFADDDITSEALVADISRFIPKMPVSPCPSMSHVVSIGQLLESALEVAGQVAGTSVSTSPLPYSTMASQCEALGTDTRRKLSNWLTLENHYTKAAVLPPSNPGYGMSAIGKRTGEDGPAFGSEMPRESWLAFRLPPASPFDNFLRAARG